jgi:signal transduction histidine kinase
MPLKPLARLLRNNLLKYFIYPMFIMLILISAASVFLNQKKMRQEDIVFVDTLQTSLTNSILSFQRQESQMLLDSISSFRKWKEAIIIDNSNVVIQAYPSSMTSKLGKINIEKCPNEISLNVRDSVVGKICYKRSFLSFFDISIIFLIICLLLVGILILYFYKYAISKIIYFMNRLTSAIDSLEKLENENTKAEFQEEDQILKALAAKINLMNYAREKEIENVEAQARLQIAEQVSHDIRSPLEALKSIGSEIKILPNNELLIFNNSIQRITDIANDLLKKTKEKNDKEQVSVVTIQNVEKLVEAIVEEKKIQFKSSNVDLRFENLLKTEISLNLDYSVLSRILSNLINNSYEAINENGKITIGLSLQDNFLKIEIKDNGKGIPDEVLNNLGERGYSFGKEKSQDSGSGLGLFYAKDIIKANNGYLKISSKLTQGTIITIELPITQPLVSCYSYVYIDNDELCRLVWQSTALKKNINLLVLDTVKKLEDYMDHLDKEYTKIYIDSDLGNNSISGEQFAEELFEIGFKELYIATGHPPERFQKLKWLKYSTKKCPF